MSEQLYSASSVATFLRCGKQWEFAYVYAIKRKPRLRMVIGLAAHSAVETNFRQKLTSKSDLPTTDVTDAFVTEFDRLVPDADIDEDEAPGEAKDSGVAVIRAYQRSVAPDIQPLAVEQEIQFDINGIPYSGYIDLVDDTEQVRDLKVTARKPANRTADYAMAMTGYALGYRTRFERIEHGVQLDYMVRTKMPYHLPVASDGPVPDKAIRGFASLISQIDRAVKAGDFLPTGLSSGACSWCGYTDLCPAYQAVHS